MIKKWLAWINLSAALIGIALLLVAGWYLMVRTTEFPMQDFAMRKTEVPKGAFARPKQDYDAIGTPALSLRFSPLSLQLPDLRRYLLYYGKNGRPDASDNRILMHFAFTGNKMPTSVPAGERLYILYDKKQTPPQYVFSPGNAETFLWIEPVLQGNQASIVAGMKDDKGHYIHEPAAYAQFVLPEKEYMRLGGSSWELGKWRVDGTLLARQRARWFGMDKFLEKHGGQEFEDLQKKQRIDFGEGDDTYSVYVGMDDCLVWNNEHWQIAKPGEASLGHPIMCVKKIDERLMNLELWDVDGKAKIALNLLKSNENWMPQNLQQNFKFVGARTRSQFVFEVDKERMLLSPHDWLILTESGWKKLVTPEDIDEYVDRKVTGSLFVFDGIERKDDRQVVVGTMFNASRTDMVPIEIPVQQQALNSNSTPIVNPDRNQKSREYNMNPVVKTQQNHQTEIKTQTDNND